MFEENTSKPLVDCDPIQSQSISVVGGLWLLCREFVPDWPGEVIYSIRNYLLNPDDFSLVPTVSLHKSKRLLISDSLEQSRSHVQSG